MSNPNGPSFRWAIIIAVIVISLWLSNGYFAHSLKEPGTFGDMFGAVNSLFTGMAFVGVIYAILLQRHEVGLLQEELRRTKDIFDAQQDLAAKQAENLKVQLFEGTFFNYFNVFTGLVEALDLRSGKRTDSTVVSKGKDVLSTKLGDILDNAKRINGGFLGSTVPKELTDKAYDYVYKNSKADLGHYFRTLYNLIKFVDGSDVQNKKLYTNLIRAQLSDDEAVLLFFNGLSSNGVEKFKPLIEKYSLLKNVDQSSKLIRDVVEEYLPSAYGEE